MNWTNGKLTDKRRFYKKVLRNATIFVSQELHRVGFDNHIEVSYVWKGIVQGHILTLNIDNMTKFLNNSLTDKELKDIENNAIQKIKSEIEKDIDEINTLERRVQLLKAMLD